MLEICSLYLDLTGQIIDPQDAMYINVDYLYDLFYWRQGIQFYEDYPKRPLNMQ